MAAAGRAERLEWVTEGICGVGAPTNGPNRRTQGHLGAQVLLPFHCQTWGGALFASHGVTRDLTPTKEGSGSLVSLRSWAFGTQHHEQLISGVAGGEAELATDN